MSKVHLPRVVRLKNLLIEIEEIEIEYETR